MSSSQTCLAQMRCDLLNKLLYKFTVIFSIGSLVCNLCSSWQFDISLWDFDREFVFGVNEHITPIIININRPCLLFHLYSTVGSYNTT